ncbi:hypothetical protein IB239_01870 [Pseudomonas sp. PDM12]|uniref:hypothetical protein n=1 Tax=Pseudomonas sp. PDM12 TaxID=2769260 RepID=UPI00177AEE55|nr:hypothetical protein [Pseudomonas sp. PDM12]MBD9653558.1 hypothetical protein [Pseudomonas sp. PDM12]
MKKIVAALALTSTAATAAPAPDVITRNLQAWAPLEVTLTNGTLQIITDENRVTDQIYHAVLGSGVCGSLWMNKGSWSGVKEVKVLNRHGRQGYVFEGGEADCVELGKLKGDASDAFILERTRWN